MNNKYEFSSKYIFNIIEIDRRIKSLNIRIEEITKDITQLFKTYGVEMPPIVSKSKDLVELNKKVKEGRETELLKEFR